MKIGRFSCNVEACFAMGKEAFLESHAHVEDAEKVWKEIEKASKKSKKNERPEDTDNGES